MAQIKKDTSLRKAILQAAVTGRLISELKEQGGESLPLAPNVPFSAAPSPRGKAPKTPQTGRQLLERIIKERNEKLLLDWQEALKTNPKAKKPAPVSASKITEEEIPFEIPENWCWCRLGEICNEIKRGKSPKYTTKSDYLAFAQKCNTKTGEIDLSLALCLDEKSIKRYSDKDNLFQGDVVINSTGGGTMGRVGYYETKVPVGIKGVYPDSHVTAIRSLGKINQRYLYYVLKYNQPKLEDCGTGSTNQTELKPSVLANLLVPLPPLAVQNAIVAKLEQALPLVDAYENAVLQKEELKGALKDKLKKAILQEAVQGKLVPQIAGEGSAKDLLAEIIAERNAKLISEWAEAQKTNPKAKKPVPVVAGKIDEDEIPFEIPENWCWCRLGELCKFLSRGKSPKYSEIKKYPVFAQKCNLKDGEISLEKAQFLNPEVLPKWKKEYKIQDGDVLVNSTGTGTVMRTRYFKLEYLGVYPFAVPDSHVTVIRTFEEIVSKYIYYCCIGFTVQNYWEQNLAGSTNQKELYIGVVENTPIPLPPLAEQKRIVAAVEELLPLCEKLGR